VFVLRDSADSSRFTVMFSSLSGGDGLALSDGSKEYQCGCERCWSHGSSFVNSPGHFPCKYHKA
jgi:hypothetical protein